VRRTLFFVLALALGLALLLQALTWYDDHLAALSHPPPPARTPTPAPATPPPLPEVTEGEVARLLRGAPSDQLEVARLLRARRATPALRSVVDQALAGAGDRTVFSELACFEAEAFPEAALRLALATLPRDRKAYAWNVEPVNLCLFRALGDHAAEDPVSAREVLLLGLSSDNGMVRDLVYHGLEHVDLPDIPAVVQTGAVSTWDDQRTAAVRAALALGAVAHAPGIVERAIFDPYHAVATAARLHLVKSDRPEAPRLVARLLATRGEREPLLTIFAERERARHDVTSALLEIATDSQAPTELRAAALEVIGHRGDVGAIVHLVPVRNSADPIVQAKGAAAIMALEARRNAGEVAYLKALAAPR
jgi:hypothetical protein